MRLSLEKSVITMKRITYHVALLFLPIIILYVTGFIISRNSTQYEVAIWMHIALFGYYLVLSLLSFSVVYQVYKDAGIWAYVIPAFLLIPVLIFFFASRYVNGEYGMYLWIWYPLFVSSTVHTTGFFVYQKWIKKTN